MYKVQSQNQNSNVWTNSGSFGSEQSAIVSAKSVIKRKNIRSVRVLDKNKNMVWIDSNLFTDNNVKGLKNFMKNMTKKDFKLLNL